MLDLDQVTLWYGKPKDVILVALPINFTVTIKIRFHLPTPFALLLLALSGSINPGLVIIAALTRLIVSG